MPYSITLILLVTFHCSNVEKSHLKITSKRIQLYPYYSEHLTLSEISHLIHPIHFSGLLWSNPNLSPAMLNPRKSVTTKGYQFQTAPNMLLNTFWGDIFGNWTFDTWSNFNPDSSHSLCIGTRIFPSHLTHWLKINATLSLVTSWMRHTCVFFGEKNRIDQHQNTIYAGLGGNWSPCCVLVLVYAGFSSRANGPKHAHKHFLERHFWKLNIWHLVKFPHNGYKRVTKWEKNPQIYREGKM